MATVYAPQLILRYVRESCRAQYLENQGKWTAFITIGGLDINELGDSKEEAFLNLGNRVLQSKYLVDQVLIILARP